MTGSAACSCPSPNISCTAPIALYDPRSRRRILPYKVRHTAPLMVQLDGFMARMSWNQPPFSNAGSLAMISCIPVRPFAWPSLRSLCLARAAVSSPETVLQTASTDPGAVSSNASHLSLFHSARLRHIRFSMSCRVWRHSSGYFLAAVKAHFTKRAEPTGSMVFSIPSGKTKWVPWA